MKKTLVLGLCATLGFASSASARLGEWVSQVDLRYGKPVESIVHDPTDKDGVKRLGQPQSLSRRYKYKGFDVWVDFSGQISVKEAYAKAEPIDSEEIDALLEANSNGKKWTKVVSDEPSSDSSTMSTSSKWQSKKVDESRWKREDGATAVLCAPWGHPCTSHKYKNALIVQVAPKGF